MNARTLSDADVEAIAEAVAAKLMSAGIALGAQPETVGVEEAMKMTNTRSPRTLRRVLADLGVKRIRAGQWRRKAIENAIARRSMSPS